MPRFIAALHDPDDPNAARRVAAGAAALRGSDALWRTALAEKGVTLLTWDRTDAFRTCLMPEGGAVFGALFRRDGAASTPVRAFEAAEAERLRDTDGAALFATIWGGYVGLVKGRARERWTVLRDPSGFLPVHHLHHAGVHLLFSDLPDALAFEDVPLEINRRVLASMAVDLLYEGRDTGIEGLTRLSAGDRLAVDVGRAEPWLAGWWRASDVVEARRLDDPAGAAEELYAAVMDSVRSWSSLYGNILVMLSGGFDSSVVTGALHETGAKSVSCLNLYTEAQLPAAARLDGRGALRGDLSVLGDERTYARSMARKCGYRLIERRRDIAQMDLGRLATAPLTARPSPLVLDLDTDQVFAEVGEEIGAEAMFSGLGGDAVFHFTAEKLSALDAVAHHGFSRRSLAAMRDAAKVSNESFWQVLAAALRYRLTGRWKATPQPEDAQRALLTDPDAVMSFEERLHGSWCEPRGLLPPGKDNHAMCMQGSIATWRDNPTAQQMDFVEPLLSQRVVEVALQIPTYTMLRHGLRRGLARETFAHLLTPEVNNRRRKATALNLQHQLVLSRLGFIRETLLDGALVRHGLLDRSKLEAAVASEARLRKEAAYLLPFLAVEFWLRSLEQERERGRARRVA